MQLELAFLERPVEPDEGSKGPWDQIDPQAQIAALVLLSRLIAQKLVPKVARAPVRRLSICANPARRKSSTIASQPIDNTPW